MALNGYKLPFNEEKDRINELNRLQKECEKLEKQIDNIEKKLSNSDFLKKAPEKIIANFKKNVQELILRRHKLEKTIQDLS